MLSVVFRGRGKGFVAGSQVVVKFSVDTNTPVVLRPSNLKRVVSMSPSWLHNLPHIGVWMDPKTLHIVFPVVESSISDMVTADQLVVAFPSPPGSELFMCLSVLHLSVVGFVFPCLSVRLSVCQHTYSFKHCFYDTIAANCSSNLTTISRVP